MQKRFFGRLFMAAALIVLLIPLLAQSAATTNPEDFMPGNALVTADFKLSGKIKTLLEPIIDSYMASDQTEMRAKTEVLMNILKSGGRFFVGVTDAKNGYAAFPVTDNQWTTLISGYESAIYAGIPVYSAESFIFAKIGSYAVLAPKNLNAVIDMTTAASPASLANNADYMTLTNSYLAPHNLSLTVNIQELMKLVEPMIAGGDEAAGASLVSWANMFKIEGLSVAEVSDGYKFTFNLLADAAKLSEKGLSLNPGGNFTPKLYKNFPTAKPIFYTESHNLKAEMENVQKMFDEILKAEGSEENIDLLETLKKETGFDAQPLIDSLEKEAAFGIQYNQNSPLPYISFVGNVAGHEAAANDFVTYATTFITDALKESDAPANAYKIRKSGNFTFLDLDITKADENYEGPPFPKITFAFGVSSDGLLIFSNYPGVEDAANRTGFASDAQFSSYVTPEMNVAGITYFNARNVWGWADGALKWIEDLSDANHVPPLDFYQGYYSLLEQIYKFRDIFIVSNITTNQSVTTGSIKIDEAKHKTYTQFIEEQKGTDTDGDGLSNYDEKYVYKTSLSSGDTDNDGVSDAEELQKGGNLQGGGKLFKDVNEGAYYTDEVGLLYQRGAIKGYDDGSFQPGKLVNRAEFTTMVMKAFEADTSNFIGVSSDFGGTITPFADVARGTWYHEPIAKAYAAGFVSGSKDSQGNWIFRPGDTITRAEAIAILNKASTALSKKAAVTGAPCKNTQFNDVDKKAWYCNAVTNGYDNGITAGRAPGKFDPMGNLNRAEAAVMIKKALDKDLEYYGSGTESFGEMTAPLGKKLTPAAGMFLP